MRNLPEISSPVAVTGPNPLLLRTGRQHRVSAAVISAPQNNTLGGREAYIMVSEVTPVVFTPDNEPYLGRQLLFHFDQLISSAMEQNAVTAPTSHGRTLSDHQHMACQVIAQALSIALSIRELIRQGYLFGAHVLLRALVERSAILLYLHLYPEEIEKWNRGWHQKEAPSLAKMFDAIQSKQQRESAIRGSELTAAMNSLLHAKPDSAPWNLVPLGKNGVGHAVSKILNRPELCDDLCANVIPWLVVIQGMMAAYFPNKPSAQQSVAVDGATRSH